MNPNSIIDGGRQRCVACGHPRREHRHNDLCSPRWLRSATSGQMWSLLRSLAKKSIPICLRRRRHPVAIFDASHEGLPCPSGRMKQRVRAKEN